ncbi:MULTISPECIES: DUF735 family protein [Borrelia]|uniref:DUF735 family protein n=3 Tax=Borrelia TaxID=138 RepID=A0AAN0X6T6_BORHE|nr:MULTISPECIES: DUF735 family protein [Borrelia]AHH03886.1 Hypothetical protein BHY_0935 [Borrelia nietonii YOR]AMR76190.1 hypothetical protein A0V01_06285 [Borrelia hermsii]ANA43820.1 hypothetical protein AXX13_P16 [Borrelia hermsii HS1]UPA08219.1 DUF735 family protein [Borrelia hermsii DAH]UPA08248.1 DUF735 family protein [Borrelia hermsii DAH]
MQIPIHLQDTGVEKFIQNELEYANTMYLELKSLNSNFTSITATRHCSSRFIAIWLSNLFRIFYSESQPLESLVANIDSVLFALRHIGTDESFIRLFKAFLNVDIEVTTPQAGVINIKLLNRIKTNFISFISPSTVKGHKPKRIRLHQTKKGFKTAYKFLTFNFLPKGYSHSIYAFIKNLIPIGRVLKITNNENIEIITFN